MREGGREGGVVADNAVKVGTSHSDVGKEVSTLYQSAFIRILIVSATPFSSARAKFKRRAVPKGISL